MVLNVLLYCQQLVKNERVQTRPWEIILIDQYPPDLSLEDVECFINHPSGVKSRVKLHQWRQKWVSWPGQIFLQSKITHWSAGNWNFFPCCLCSSDFSSCCCSRVQEVSMNEPSHTENTTVIILILHSYIKPKHLSW